MPVMSPEELKQYAKDHNLRLALIVTALDLELKAVMAHLAPVATVSGRGGTIYEAGIIEEEGPGWLCVVVECGMGTHNAQGAVTDAHIEFDFEVALFSGIGGSRKDDVPLGSVVAGDHVYMPYGEKIDKDGRSIRPREFPTDHILLEIARKVRRDETWQGRIKETAGVAPPTDEAYPTVFPPLGHIAPIVSTEGVVATRKGGTADIIAEDYGDACIIEMEGYGALLAAHRERTPAIVIRGVSDMAQDKDHATDKVFQPIAASHAAAFAFEFLLVYGTFHPAREFPEASPPIPLKEPSDPVAPPVRSSLVINIDAEPASVTPERIAAIEAMLRSLTGDADVTIMRIERGSIRLHVADPNGSLARLDTSRIGDELEERFSLRLLGLAPESDVAEVDRVRDEMSRASMDLLGWPSTLPDGAWIERPELNQLLETVESTSGSTTAVIGDPGSGKSALLAELGRRLVERGTPVLAIKADLLEQDIVDEEGLRVYLGLAQLPSALITEVAKFRPVYVLIDQLDALARYVDLRTGRLNALLNLVRRLGKINNVHIVLSARRFEYEHDVRLRAVSAESISLELPAWSDVLALLETRGIAAGGWPTDAQEVLRFPQALATYLNLDERALSEPLGSYQTVLDRLWAERVQAGSGGLERSRLASDIAETMSDRESLWLPRAMFEEREPQLKELVAAGVLTENAAGSGIGFSHQTIFDHALARRFAGKPGALSAFVIERQTSLFIRPKVWAALTYLRGVDLDSYATEIEALWHADGLRRHIKLLLLEFLGQQSEPTDREEVMMASALADPAERAAAFRAIIGSAGWIRRLARRHLAAAMREGPPAADWMLSVLREGWRGEPEEVQRLLLEEWLPDPGNDLRFWQVLDAVPELTPPLLSAALTILSRTDFAPFAVEFVISAIGADQPREATQLVLAILRRQLEAAKALAGERAAAMPKDLEGEARTAFLLRNDPRDPLKRVLEDESWDILSALAEGDPSSFLDLIWPWYLDVLETIREHQGAGEELSFPLHLESDFRFEGEHSLGLPERPILAAIRTALERLAETNPDGFRAFVRTNENIALAPVQRVIAHAFLTAAETYAHDALAFLMGDPRRLYLGGIEDFSGTTTRLVAGVADFWSDDDILRFEKHVRNYKPVPPADAELERRRAWLSIARSTRANLLRALPEHRASPETRRMLQEERRAHQDRKIGVRFGEVTGVGSIMEAEAMAKASDADILNAFRELPDATGWNHPRYFAKGGNIQLARAFATFAKAHPSRALTIISKFDPEIGTRAAGHALEALAAELSPDVLEQTILDLTNRGFGSEEFRISVAQAIDISRDRDTPVSTQLESLLRTWLLEPAEEVQDIPDSESDAGDGSDDGEETRSLIWGGGGGLGIVPQGRYPILETLTDIHLDRRDIAGLQDLLGKALRTVRDPEAWQHLLLRLPHLRPREAEDAKPALTTITMVVEAYPQLLGTPELAYLLGYMHWWTPDLAEDIVRRWESVPSRRARRGLGELITLLALLHPERQWSGDALQRLIADTDSTAERLGVAATAAHLWMEPNTREQSTDLLIRVLEGAGEAEWGEVFDLFRIVEDLPLDHHTDRLLEAIATKLPEAPPLDPTFLVERLAALLPNRATLIAAVAEAIVANTRTNLADLRTGTAATAPELVDMAVTLHRLGPATREAGVRLFESLLEIDAYMARQTLDELDARFRAERPRNRRRLPRRNRQRPAKRALRPAGTRGGAARA